MANDKKQKQKKKATQFEKDERRSFIIAIIVCVIVVLLVTIALIAIYRSKRTRNRDPVIQETVQTEESTDTGGYSETGSILVMTQQELDDALNDPNNVEILFQTEESVAITIPAAKYTEVALTVDAPYADVINEAIFKSVTINRIASNTWTEKASGNSFYISAVTSHLIISENAVVSRVELSQSNSTLAIENAGTISLLTLAADSTIVSVDDNDFIEQIVISKKTNLNLLGESQKTVLVDIGYDADGSILNTTIPVTVNSYASLTFDCSPGAENSSLTLKNNTKSAIVSNNMEEDLKVVEASGTESTVAAGEKEKTFEGLTTSTLQSSSTSSNSGSTTTSSSSGGSSSKTYSQITSSGSSGSSGTKTSTTTSSSSSSSQDTSTSETQKKETKESTETKETTESGNDKKIYSQSDVDKKIESAISDANKDLEAKIEAAIQALKDEQPIVIQAFKSEEPFDAGTYGNAIPLKELYEKLPKELIGLTSDGDTIVFPVNGWLPNSDYSELASPGVYDFYAWLGTPTTDCVISTDAKAFVPVCIKSFDGITYQGDYAKQLDVMKLFAADGNSEQIEEYYVVTNRSDRVLMVNCSYSYLFTDSDSESGIRTLVEKAGEPIILYPGATSIFERKTPGSEVGVPIEAPLVKLEASILSEDLKNLLKIDESRKRIFNPESDLIVSDFYFTYDFLQGDGIRYGFDVKVSHSDKEIKKMSEVIVTILYFDNDGKVIGRESFQTGQNGPFLYKDTEENVKEASETEFMTSLKEPGSRCDMIFTYPNGSAEKKFFIFTNGGYELVNDG